MQPPPPPPQLTFFSNRAGISSGHYTHVKIRGQLEDIYPPLGMEPTLAEAPYSYHSIGNEQ